MFLLVKILLSVKMLLSVKIYAENLRWQDYLEKLFQLHLNSELRYKSCSFSLYRHCPS